MSGVPAIAANGRRRRIAGVAVLALGQAAAAGGAAFATRDVFAALHLGGAAPAASLVTIAGAGVVIAALRMAERIVAERLGGEYVAEAREKLFLRAARTPPRALARRSRGGQALRFVGDMAAIRGWVASGLPRLISAAITIPATLGVLIALDPRLAVAAAPPVVLAIIGLFLLGGPLGRSHRRKRRLRARLSAQTMEQMAHGAALRLLGQVGALRNRLRDRSRDLIAASVACARLAGAARAAPDAAAGVAAAAMLAVAFRTGAAPATAAGALAALGLAVQPLRHLAEVHDRRQAWTVARDNLERALSLEALPARSTRRRPPRRDAPALTFENVRLAEGPRLNATLAAGEIATLTGPSASGKSLLLMAAAGLEPVDAGRIRVFGQAPSALPASVIAYCGPGAPLLRGTVRRNLRGAQPAATDAALEHALSFVRLGALFQGRQGLATRIAEGGRDLSASERARLVLARVVVAQPRLVLIDADDGFGIDIDLVQRLVARLKASGTALLISGAAAVCDRVAAARLELTPDGLTRH